MKKKRNVAIDFLRGLAILLMLITHINGFFLDGPQKPLDYITFIGATVCFSVFLFCYAYTYGFKLSKYKKEPILKHIKRGGILLIVYYFTAFGSFFLLNNQLGSTDIIEIITLQKFPPYTEFMLTFAILTFLMIPLYPLLRFVLKKNTKISLYALIALQLLSFIFYALSYRFQNPFGLEGLLYTLKILFVGGTNAHTFPILIYSPIFMFGLSWGFLGRSKKLSRKNEKILINAVFLVSLTLTVLMNLLNLSRWERWPPSIYFLFWGITFISGVISFKKFIKRLGKFDDYLIYIGQNSLLIFFLNVFVIAGISWAIGYKKFDSFEVLGINIALISFITAIPYVFKVIKNQYKMIFKERLFAKGLILFMLVFLSALGLTYFGVNTYFKPYLNPGGSKDFINSTQTIKSKIKNRCSTFNDYSNEELIELHTDKNWLLISDEIADSSTFMLIAKLFTSEYDWSVYNITYFIPDTDISGTMELQEFKSEGKLYYTKEIDIGELDAGEYEVGVVANYECDPVKAYSKKINYTHPLYVSWTQDWEGYDVDQQYLDDMEELSDRHGMPMTHFFNPRIYVPGVMSHNRAKYLTDWVKQRRDKDGDSIGLHLHMFPDMVAEVLKNIDSEKQFDIRYEPKWGYYKDNGYDIPTYAYTTEELEYILSWSKDKFNENGLGRPISFRAGGWMADGSTLKALQNEGFEVDSSGRTSATRGTNKLPVAWNLKKTSQPYQPNIYNLNSSNKPTLSLWEFPNNGADSWSYSDKEMIERFDANWDGGFLDKPKSVVFLSHPHWFYVDKPKMDSVLTHTDNFLYEKDKGPVLYVTLEEAYENWPKSD